MALHILKCIGKRGNLFLCRCEKCGTPARMPMPCEDIEIDGCKGLPGECRHLGDLTEEDAEVIRRCGGYFTHVWECDLMGRCTPNARTNNPEIIACIDCKEFQKWPQEFGRETPPT
jgi:hypothetical protein